jgi:hypothetical protein
MKFRLALLAVLACGVAFSVRTMAQEPVEEDGPLLGITEQIATDTAIVESNTTSMNTKLISIEQLIRQNIQPDIETMRKIQVNQADIGMLMDKLTTLQQRGVLLVGTSGGSSGIAGAVTSAAGAATSAAGGTVPAAGYNWNSITQTAVGLGGGFAGNYISPMFQMPFGSMGQMPSALFPIQSSALSSLVSVASNYATSALGIGTNGTGFGSGSTGIASAINSSIGSVFGGTGFNLGNQVGATTLNGAMMVADDAFIRPAEGSGGSIDGAFAQLVNGGFGQVLQSTPANSFNFLAASALGGATSTYSPSVGSYNSGSNLINSILTNGASNTNPAAYANFNQIASLVAANPTQYLVGGSKLTLTDQDVSNFQSAQQNGTAPTINLNQFSLSSLLRKSSKYLVTSLPSGWMGFEKVQTNPISAIMSIGPSMGTAGQLQSSFGAAGARVSALDLTKTTNTQYITYTQQILQATIQIEQGLEKISGSLTDAEKNAVPQLAEMQTQIQGQIKSYQDEIQSMSQANTQLDQQLYGQLQNYDASYKLAVDEAAQRAPLIAHAASVEAQANGGATSTTYFDPLYGKRFMLVHVDGYAGLVLALR